MHGGKSRVGPASGTWINGRHSKILPKRLLADYQASRDDPEKLVLEAELAVLDARTSDLLLRVDTGESGRLWGQLRKAWTAFETARRANDPVALVTATHALGDLITAGYADWAAWDEVMGLIERRRKLVESERKRLTDERHVITIDAAMSLMNQLIDAVKEVGDDQTLRAITREFARLTGTADPTAAADC